MSKKNSSGMSTLAAVFSSQMQRVTETPRILDFGEIEENYSLKTDTFPISIPKTDYVICRHIGNIPFSLDGGKHDGHESGNGEHEHEVILPAIKPGDRVLVAWIGSEAVVIDTVVTTDKLEV